MNSGSYFTSHEFCKQMVVGLFTVVLVLSGLYIYFVSKSVVNVIVRKEVEQEIAEANSRIGELELSYLERKQALTLERAHSFGFRQVTEKAYVTRHSLLSSRVVYDDEI